MEFEMGAKMIR